MVKLILALVLVAHGIGHSMGILGVFRLSTINPAWHGDSWLLTGAIGTGPAQAIGIVLWTASIVGFALLAGIVMGWVTDAWWQPLAIASSVASLVAIAIFPLAFPAFSTLAAAVVDVVLLVAVVWMAWAPSELAA
jgi:hypothetical protein